jgi:hypothetical protein
MLGVEPGVQHGGDNHISRRAGETVKISDSHNISLIKPVSSAAIIRENRESFKALVRLAVADSAMPPIASISGCGASHHFRDNLPSLPFSLKLLTRQFFARRMPLYFVK